MNPRRSSWPRKAQPQWYARLRAGDVLQMPSGDFRLVREVRRYSQRVASGRERFAIIFAIRRCSWTERPYTVYFSSDTVIREARYIGPYHGKLTALDFRLLRDIERDERGRRKGCELSCCDVRGLP